MDVRRIVIRAIADLTPDQRAQLLLYLLGDDYAALDVIDSGKWRWQEFMPSATSGRIVTPTTDNPGDPGVPEGKDLSS